METRIHQSSKGIWIFIDGKHKKTVPSKYKDIIADNIKTLSIDRKCLNEQERALLDNALFAPQLQFFIEELKKTDKHLFSLIETRKVIGARKVLSRYGTRYELSFDGIMVRCPRGLYAKYPTKLPVAYLNY